MNPDQSLWTEASTASVTSTVAGSYEGSHYKKKIDAKWSSASSAGQKSLPPMSKDDKLRAMLGHKQLESGALNLTLEYTTSKATVLSLLLLSL